MLVLLAGFSFSTYFCVQMYKKFQDSPIITSIESNHHPIINRTFPAVVREMKYLIRVHIHDCFSKKKKQTICNVNKVSHRNLQQVLSTDSRFVLLIDWPLDLTLRESGVLCDVGQHMENNPIINFFVSKDSMKPYRSKWLKIHYVTWQSWIDLSKTKKNWHNSHRSTVHTTFLQGIYLILWRAYGFYTIKGLVKCFWCGLFYCDICYRLHLRARTWLSTAFGKVKQAV